MKEKMIFVILFFVLCFSVPAQAANVTIRSCQIETNKTTVCVTAAGPSFAAGSDGSYYLFALLPYETGVTRNSILAATIRQSPVMNFRASLNLNRTDSILYRKFVVAVKKNNSYQIVSNAMYITNPERLAAKRSAFPKAASKKGLHIKPSMIADAEDLGIKHAAVNICLDQFVATSSQRNSKSSYAYTYQGKKYWFTKYACQDVDAQVKQLSETNVVVSGILLLRKHGGGSALIAPEARKAQKNYYGFGTMDRTNVETLAALMHFLGERYMNSNGRYGTVVNWIVGNEVNNYNDYNYLGKLSFQEYIEAYTRSFRIVSLALRSVYSNARVYISLDHLWNMLQGHGKCFTSKATLDAFAAEIAREGAINWNLAFHPYPAPLTDPVFWDDQVTSSDSTRQVTMKNLSYLTNYVTQHFPKDVRIILSEQGFTSVSNGKTNEMMQAAAWAYAYYITEFNDKVDSFIMNRHVDHVEETKYGLYLGVWTNQKGNLEYAERKKEIWNVFKYIDSANSRSVSQFALRYIHASSWESLIPGFNWSRFSKMGGYSDGKFRTIKTAKKTKGIGNSLKYGYNGTVKKSGSKTTVKVKTSMNPNMYSGAGWRFPGKLNFSSRTKFTCKLKISGMKEKYAHVRIRFFSGSQVYEAAAKVKGGSTRQVAVDLSKWSYRKSVDKIQIWVRPNGKTKWKKGAKIVISSMKQASSVK